MPCDLQQDLQIEKLLDKLDAESGKQKEEIQTDCSGGDGNPDIFKQDITVWCAKGCAPLPQDFDTYWDPQYNPQSPTAGLDLAPIQPVKNYTVIIKCRDGYAPVNGNGQTNEAYCSDLGWVPALSNIATCTSGCKDIRNDVQYGSSADLRSTTLGGAPFNIGDVLTFTCDKGYALSGSKYVTCSSTQSWTPETLPECIKTDQAAVSEARRVGRRGGWWVLLAVIQVALFGLVGGS
ncbi:hypothetical protein ACHWQZ_G017620 [Mnemiopsis leidyi]